MDQSGAVMPWSQRLCFGVGHALNDLTASMWFSYLIVYLQLVLEFDATYAGLILLIGQVADAVATPLLGFEASAACKGNTICEKYGRRKTMHLIGTICVLLSFPFIFSVCPGCTKASEWALTVLLIPIVLIFQFGWAATQISHLSLIPILTPYEHERDILTVIRYSVDIMSDVCTYVIVWMVFDFTSSKSRAEPRIITPAYASKFVIIVIVIELLGALFSLIFHVGVKEVRRTTSSSRNCSRQSNSETSSVERSTPKRNLKWNEWLKQINLYQIGLLYMLTRLFSNMCSVFTPLYLQENLGANDDMIAKIPMVMNVTGFVASFAVPKIFKLIGKKCTFLIGTGIGIGACAWVHVGEGYPFCAKGVYGVAMLYGIASSLLVVSGLSFIHDLIGTSTESGSFVYGCMSFWDKMANGIAGMLVQRLHSTQCFQCNWFYKNVMAYGVGGVAACSAIVLLTMLPRNLSKRNSLSDHKEPAQEPLLSNTTPDVIAYGALAADGSTESQNSEEKSSETNV